MRVYSEGGTDIEVCKALRMSKKSFDKREKDDASFAQLVEHGRLCAQAWWLEVGRKAAKNGAPANASTFWSMWMKNRYGWAEKSEVSDTKAPKDMSNEELQKQLRDVKARLEKTPANVEVKNILAGKTVN